MNIMILILIIFIAVLIFFNKKGIPIFLYHQVNEFSNVKPELFEEHLKIIKKLNMKTLTMTEYYHGKTQKNSILLTFDDGYFDNYKIVFPLLKKYNMKATIFLNTLFIKDVREKEATLGSNYEVNFKAIKNYIEGKNPEIDDYMSWEEISEMHESGLVDFQAHSHKHTAIFCSDKIKGFTKKEKMDFTDIFLYFKAEDNYPIFKKRGEYSERGILIEKKFFDEFKNYCENNILNLSGIGDKEKLKLAQEYIDKNKKYFHYEDKSEYEARIKNDFLENRQKIEKNLGKKVEFFCWPWGHRSKEGMEILKSLGVKGFVSTKKGSNYIKPDWNFIKRIELRNYEAIKFKINLLLARNFILGKIYQYLS